MLRAGSSPAENDLTIPLMDLVNSVFKFDNFLAPDDLTSLTQYAAALPFTQPSFVFHREKEEHVEDAAVRKSHTVTVDDEKMLQFVTTRVLPSVTAKHELVAKLARDHVTFIKYDEGGFFDWHQDFEKYIVNDRLKWVEMHLIICLQGAEEGGELQTREGPEGGILAHPLVTNGCIVFDKSIEHRGNIVTKGTKIIMTVDVLVSTVDAETLADLGIDLELEPLMETGCMSYRHDYIKKYAENFDATPVFGYLECIRDGTHIRVIYDILGAYYIDMYRKKTCYRREILSNWTRPAAGDDTDDIDAEDDIDIRSIVRALDKTVERGPYYYCNIWDVLFEGESADVVSGTAQLATLTGDPIPTGTPVERMLSLKIIHKPKERNVVGYTYHCNEPSYGTTELISLMGFLGH